MVGNDTWFDLNLLIFSKTCICLILSVPAPPSTTPPDTCALPAAVVGRGLSGEAVQREGGQHLHGPPTLDPGPWQGRSEQCGTEAEMNQQNGSS